jgi:hypothetical protein
VLSALADRCRDDGRNAFPSVQLIAAESEIGVRTADHCLAALRTAGFIDEQAPPRQHCPRTWQLNLDVIRAHVAPQALAYLDSLQGRKNNVPGSQDSTQGRKNDVPGSQDSTQGRKNDVPGSQDRADDPVNGTNRGNRRAALRAPHPAKAQRAGDRTVGNEDALTTFANRRQAV